MEPGAELSDRANGTWFDKPLKPATLNRELALFKYMFSYAIRGLASKESGEPGQDGEGKQCA